MAELRIPIIVENKGKKAFKETDNSVKSLTKNFKKLAGAAGIGLSIQAMVNFGKASAKAFIEDEKAARRLGMAVKNLGLGFETPRIEQYISDLSKMSGITDDQLRPAMQKLLTTTGSVTKSQELLKQALDISAGSGVDYETVVNDLSMAFLGQTKGLSKYATGLTKAELKTMKFADIQAKLGQQFSGANADYLTTYAGKFQLISTAASEAQETIGGALLNSVQDLFGAKDITELIGMIETLGTKIAKLIDDTTWKWKKFWFATSDRAILEGLNPFSTYVQDGLKALEIQQKVITAARNTTTFGYLGSMPVGIYPTAAEIAARKKAEADAAKRAKELAAMQAKGLADTKKKLALEKASKTLDLDRIGLTAALKGKISETDKLSLQLQIALLDKNDALAAKLAADLETAMKNNLALQKALLATPKAPNPYEDWKPPVLGTPVPKGITLPSYPEQKSQPGQPGFVGPVVPNLSNVPSNGIQDYGLGGSSTDSAASRAMSSPKVEVTVVLNDKVVTDAITEVQQNNSLSGTFSNLNRSGFKGAVAI